MSSSWRVGFVAAHLACVMAVWSGSTEAEGIGAKSSEQSVWPTLKLEPIVTSGLQSPVLVSHSNDGSGRLYIVEQVGRIQSVTKPTQQPTPFLDIIDRVLDGGERGLLGLAFHPDFRINGRFFINYTRKPDGATVLAEYRVSKGQITATREERVLLLVPQPYANHNGGMVAFGPDGFLYIALGDGGAGGDPGNRAQNRNELLGKILRIDVNRGDPYGIPSDNPFAKGGGRPEVYAYGLRNPWRFSFDRTTGDLLAADAGQYNWEEIDRIVRGGNYGWPIMEGRHCFRPSTGCSPDGLIPPVVEYARTGGRCVSIGGYVYRGKIATLQGAYLYADYCSGEVFGARLSKQTDEAGAREVLLRSGLHVSSFGEDEEGEVYLCDHDGAIYRLVAADPRR